MKRFDKGYIYSCLLSDLFTSIVIPLIFLDDVFLGENPEAEEMMAALPAFAAVAALIYLGFIIYRLLYYKTSGYELTETEIKCNRGVFFRKRSVIDYRKVHAVNKKQNLIHRIFGIAVLTVDSGSANTAHQAEIAIVEKAEIVDRLMDELRALKENGAGRTASTPAEEILLLSHEDSLYCFTSKRKMLYTLINIVSTALGTAVFGILAIIAVGICKYVLELDSLGSWGQYILSAVLLTIGAVLLLSVFSFIGCMINSFVGYHKFTIAKRGDGIEISYGLLERHTNTFGYDRIKAVKISQGLIQRMLGFASIKLEVIGYTNGSGDDNSSDIGVLIPFCKYDEIGEILSKVLPEYVPDERQTKAVSYFPFVSWFGLILGMVTGVALLTTVAILAFLGVPSDVIFAVIWSTAGVAALLLAGKLVSAAFCYRNSGIAIHEGRITAYYGGFTRNVTVFKAKHLIAAENVTTPLRKKHGITTLVMHLKTNAESNEVKVHIQKDTLAEELEKLLIV